MNQVISRWRGGAARAAGAAGVAALAAAASLAPVTAQEASLPEQAMPAATRERPLAANPGGPVVRLGVEEAARRAATWNEDVLMARAERARSEGIVTEVRARSLPEITADFGYTRNVQRPVLFFNTDQGVQQITIGNDNDYVFGLQLRQSLLDFSLGPARRAARLTEDATAAQVEAARTAVALQARVEYYDILLDAELMDVQERALEHALARLAQVEEWHRAGLASEFDLLTAQVDAENLRPAVIEARNRLEVDRERLKRTLGLAPETELVLTDSLERPGVPLPEEPVARALRDRPDLAAQRFAVDLQHQNFVAQRRSALPSFDLVAALARRGSSDRFFPEERDFSQSASAALNFSLPLFDGRERAGRVQQAEAARDRERYRLQRLEREVRLEVEQALRGVAAAEERVAASESNVARAERALEIAQTRFRNGLSTQLELGDAELAAARARTNFAEALYAYSVERARLLAAVGGR